MASKLASTLSHVDFFEFGGWWHCDWSDTVAIFLDLFKLPHHKDNSCPPGAVKPVLEFIPDPLMFQRGWAVLMPHLTDDDWTETTVAILSERLRIIRDTKLSDAEKGLFTIRCDDLLALADPFSLLNTNWHHAEYGSTAWAMALTWDIGSAAAYEDGTVNVASFIYHFVGEFSDVNSVPHACARRHVCEHAHGWERLLPLHSTAQ